MFFSGKSITRLGRFPAGTKAVFRNIIVEVTGTIKSEKDGTLYCDIYVLQGEHKGCTQRVKEISLKTIR